MNAGSKAKKKQKTLHYIQTRWVTLHALASSAR